MLLRITLRHLWRNRLFTALNVAGLSIGLSAAWVMYQYVTYEFGYESKIADTDRIYRVVSRFVMDGKESGNSGVPRPMLRAAAAVTGVEMAVPVVDQFISQVQPGLPGGNGAWLEEIRNVTLTTDNYFKLVPYRWLAGNPIGALSQPDQVVLTQSRATKYFGNIEPQHLIGQTVTYNDTMVLRISGVVADLDFPSSFIGAEFHSISRRDTKKERWAGVNSNEQLFLLLAPHTRAEAVKAQINQVSDENSKADLAKWSMQRWHELQPMNTVHFDEDYASHIRTANKNVLYALMGIAGFLLALACINYINLATAQIPQRAKEIGIRKTLGGGRSGILLHFLGETAVVTTFAVLLAGALAAAFFQYFDELLPEDVLKFVDYRATAVFLVALITLVSLVAGGYPGWLVTLAQPVRTLRGQVDNSQKGSPVNLRKGLIVFQFFIAQVFLAGAVIVGQQLHFMLNKPLGFNKDAVLLVDIPWKLMMRPEDKEKHFTMLEEMKKLPGIASGAMGEPLFSQSFSSNNHSHVDAKGVKTEHNLYRKFADSEVIPLYQLPVLAGRNLNPSDTISEYVINETAAKTFGFASPQDAIGQFLSENEGPTVPIVGVVSDFHTGSFTGKIEPVAFMTDKSSLSTLNLKLASNRPGDWKKTIDAMEAVWRQFYPSAPFKYDFYDDTLQATYEDEQNLAKLINLATAVAMIISCLGLFGLATFMAVRRSKEIGIRKVLGASVSSVVGLLSREFILLVGVGFILSVPVVWYFMQKWLTNYSYHIDIQWWMFLSVAVAASLIALITVSFQSIKAALANPVKSLKSE